MICNLWNQLYRMNRILNSLFFGACLIFHVSELLHFSIIYDSQIRMLIHAYSMDRLAYQILFASGRIYRKSIETRQIWEIEISIQSKVMNLFKNTFSHLKKNGMPCRLYEKMIFQWNACNPGLPIYGCNFWSFTLFSYE